MPIAIRGVMLVLISFPIAAAGLDLTGLWYAPPKAAENNQRDLLLAIHIENSRITGEVETPTRNAAIADGRLLPDGFSGIAQSDWDGKLARRPVEAHLKGDILHLRIQAWPAGPMADYEMHRISDEPRIPKLTPIPVPPIKDLPYNKLAKTPPMGWNSWNKFGCGIDDAIIREMAGMLVSSGMKAVGYEFINIDDCWQSGRDKNGMIQPDAKRFPGMKALADYVHGKGLKLGIYSSPGPKTCAGFEGSYGHEEQDARTYADWGIDLLKYDWCSAGKLYKPEQMHSVYQKMGAALQAAGRPIVYSICQYGLAEVWKWGAQAGGNLWRTTTDIGDNWNRMEEIGFDRQLHLAPYAGPGHWNDPDMLEVGNGGMSMEEYRTYMSIWSLLAAPLLAGNDLRSMSRDVKSILMNPEVIAIDQDPLGNEATRAWKRGAAEVWSRPLQDGSVALGVFNRGDTAHAIQFSWADAGLHRTPARIRDLWLHKNVVPVSSFSGEVPGHGVMLLRTW